MQLKKIGLYSVSIAALALGLVGCGGDGGGGGAAGTTDIDAALGHYSGTAETGAVGDGTTTVRVRLADGSAVDAIVPVGLTINIGDEVAGLNGGNMNASFVAEGPVGVNGHDTGLKVGIDGRINGAIALPAAGEVSMVGEGTTRELTFQALRLDFARYEVAGRRHVSLPVALRGRHLDNGMRTTNGTVECWFRADTPDSFRARLFVDYGNGVTIHRGPSALTMDPATGLKYVKWDANGGTTIPTTGVHVIHASCN